MRLFIASEVGKEVSQYLHELQVKLKRMPAKQTYPTSFHITYAFLGQKQPDKVEQLKEQLASLSFDPIPCRLSGLSWFPERGDVRVVWARLAPEKPVIELQKKIIDLIGFKPDKDFIPHITLSRVKNLYNKKEFKALLEQLKVEKFKFTIDSVKLIQSTLIREGAEYRDLFVATSK